MLSSGDAKFVDDSRDEHGTLFGTYFFLLCGDAVVWLCGDVAGRCQLILMCVMCWAEQNISIVGRQENGRNTKKKSKGKQSCVYVK